METELCPQRFVALGDSFTEGIGDPHPLRQGSFRGWADRVAEVLAQACHDFTYANLAVRGKLLREIVSEQLGPALTMKPDLVSFCAGGNDIIRPGSDPDALAVGVNDAISALRSSGATVLMFTGPDIGARLSPWGLRGKVAIYNENLRTVAENHGAVLIDLWASHELSRAHMWSPDRLHLSSTGHEFIAAIVLNVMRIEYISAPYASNTIIDLAPPRFANDAKWARQHLLPWVLRRLQGKSSGAGREAKRPALAAVAREDPDPYSTPEYNPPPGRGAVDTFCDAPVVTSESGHP
ncbi:SGNH/GDSL hydrolase family protein [Arthrobacter sp. CAN_C5]|uniref:SGNH/GDSL hydrolase family protein n=1 Tax=Arthrobacter sp. CAN_C5 TaxID=2760706 RepID=UPI001AE455D0|nr:SGNH/GDSL hydrolase family protein [Arthrobacter sp. CAN_C5]